MTTISGRLSKLPAWERVTAQDTGEVQSRRFCALALTFVDIGTTWWLHSVDHRSLRSALLRELILMIVIDELSRLIF
jgi:hypothetical protein